MSIMEKNNLETQQDNIPSKTSRETGGRPYKYDQQKYKWDDTSNEKAFDLRFRIDD